MYTLPEDDSIFEKDMEITSEAETILRSRYLLKQKDLKYNRNTLPDVYEGGHRGSNRRSQVQWMSRELRGKETHILLDAKLVPSFLPQLSNMV